MQAVAEYGNVDTDISKWYQANYDKYSKPAKEDSPQEYAKLSKAAYMSREDAKGYISEKYVIDFELSNRNRTVFYDTERETAVIAFKGTDPSNFKDIGSDLYILGNVESLSSRFENAYSAVQRARLKYGYERVEVTGHSLGGSQALYVNRELGVRAYAFNPGAGPGRFTSDLRDMLTSPFGSTRNASKANVYLVPGDPISVGHGLSNSTVRYVRQKSRFAHDLDNFL